MLAYLAYKLDLISFDVLYDQDVGFRQKVEAEVVDCVAENGLLNKKDIALHLLDLLDHVQKIYSLLFEDFVHLPVIIHYDLILHL